MNHVIVTRLWQLYPWPERGLPMRKMTVDKLRTFPVQAEYISDDARTRRRPTRAWDYGRIRFFYERLIAGGSVDAITVDNECDGDCIYPIPVLIDGHHRLAASHLACVEYIAAEYSGRLDLLRYLTGARKTCPTECLTS